MYELPQELPNAVKLSKLPNAVKPHGIFAAGGGPLSPHKKKNLASQDIGKLKKKISEMFGFNGEYDTAHPKAKF